ncbi:MAG: N-acetylmuramoyl-L-alanine amidase [Candidatus Sericytochromatia bacterium]|nr:N-acetylmuramoyl-L-alanine amidase [Candidatus Sericytochromatia bacterium]
MGHGRALGLLALAVTTAACQLSTGTPAAQRADTTGSAMVTASVPMPPIASVVLSPNIDDRKSPTPTCIVLHHTAATADANATAKFFASPKAKVSAHFVVDRTGYIVRCVQDAKMAHHAGVSQFQGMTDVNQFSLGIEIANVGDHVEPYPPAQVAAVVKLTAALASKYRIPVSNVTRHRDIAMPAGRKQDTSDTLDLSYVHKAVQAMLKGTAPEAYTPTMTLAGYDPRHQDYRVQAGDSLAEIADTAYDTPAMAEAILRLNPRTALQAGATLRMPTDYPY